MHVLEDALSDNIVRMVQQKSELEGLPINREYHIDRGEKSISVRELAFIEQSEKNMRNGVVCVTLRD